MTRPKTPWRTNFEAAAERFVRLPMPYGVKAQRSLAAGWFSWCKKADSRSDSAVQMAALERISDEICST